MSCWRLVTLLLFAGLAVAFPLNDDMSLGDDTELVESTIREVRALPPANMDLEAAGTEYEDRNAGGKKDDIGYLRTHDTKGDKGYQHFNSFQKKGGDSYGFQTESSFGRADGGDKKGGYQDQGSYSESKKGEQDGAHSGGEDDGSEEAEYEGASSEDDEVYYKAPNQEEDDDEQTALRGNEHSYEKHDSYNKQYGDDAGDDDDRTAFRDGGEQQYEEEQGGDGGEGSDYDRTAFRDGGEDYAKDYASSKSDYDRAALRDNFSKPYRPDVGKYSPSDREHYGPQ